MPTAPASQKSLRTPRAAAIAGLVFSVLLLVIFALLRTVIPAEPQEQGAWLTEHPVRVRVALNIVPFAGIAFLWFIAVLRDRLGEREDRFFATVFLGSGLLFLAMLFVLAAIADGLLAAFGIGSQRDAAAFQLARAAAFSIANVYMVKMAAVFMFTSSTLIISTEIAPRWIAMIGYGLAVVLLAGSAFVSWSFLVFPLWILLVSASILRDNLSGAASLRAPPSSGRREDVRWR
jgi:hypothetical protein